MHQFYLKYLNKQKKIFEKYLHKYFREEFNMIISPKIFKKQCVDLNFKSISYMI